MPTMVAGENKSEKHESCQILLTLHEYKTNEY